MRVAVQDLNGTVGLDYFTIVFWSSHVRFGLYCQVVIIHLMLYIISFIVVRDSTEMPCWFTFRPIICMHHVLPPGLVILRPSRDLRCEVKGLFRFVVLASVLTTPL